MSTEINHASGTHCNEKRQIIIIIILIILIIIIIIIIIYTRQCGKESTEVQITQNKGKESENSYRKLKSSWWTGTLQFSVRVLTFLSLILNNLY